MTYAEKTTYKRGATDFSSQVAKMKEAGCDGVVMGTIIRETIGTIGTARKLEWNPAFVGTTASYFGHHPQARRRGGERLLLGLHDQLPYEDDKNEKVRAWFASYKGKYSEDPTVLSAYGYELTDLFVKAANKAGKDLNPTTLTKSLELDRSRPTSSAATSRSSRPPSTSAPTARCCARSRTASGARCRSI